MLRYQKERARGECGGNSIGKGPNGGGRVWHTGLQHLRAAADLERGSHFAVRRRKQVGLSGEWWMRLEHEWHRMCFTV